MNAQEKIRLLEVRLRNLSARDSDNYGVRGKIIREIRKLQKEEGSLSDQDSRMRSEEHDGTERKD